MNSLKQHLKVAALLTACSAVAAFGQDSPNAAHRFLAQRSIGQEVLQYVHMGASYNEHRYIETRGVTGRPNDFALVYHFGWEGDGDTDIAFLCNASGQVYGVQVVKTNAGWSRPFVFANASIQLLGNAILQANKDWNSNVRRIVQQLVDEADAQGLLTMVLKTQQAGSR